MWDRERKGREKEGEGSPCLAGDSRTFHTLLAAQQLQDSAPLALKGKSCSVFTLGKVPCYFGSKGCVW